MTLTPDTARLRVAVNTAYIETYLPPLDEVFSYNKETNKVTLFAPAHNGNELDLQKLSKDLEIYFENLLHGKNPKNTLHIDAKKVAPTGARNEFGIHELLGSGYSSFRGSTRERRTNILNGLSKIDGLLIAPSETFSLNNAMTPYTHENGYIDGLVIKGKKIVPEIGGGLCQIGTTVFRAAMNSGLPIKERVNHSIWVSYYNDPRNGNPGTDATLYEGVADLKFKNNTEHHLMLRVRHLDGDDLYIELWGKSDGRKGSYSLPQIFKRYEYDKTPKTNYISELPTGVKMCNGPFKGASTVFTYTIKQKDGTTVNQNFYSYYRPEGLVCQVGL